jgi:hypothetical protein
MPTAGVVMAKTTKTKSGDPKKSDRVQMEQKAQNAAAKHQARAMKRPINRLRGMKT